MRLRAAFLAALLALGGCSKDPYVEIVDKQVANWNEMADILATARDPDSMQQAEARLAERTKKFHEVELERKLLPQPDEAAMARIVARKERMQAAVDRVQEEMRRIKELPGGQEFFDRVSKSVSASQRGVPR